MVPPTEIRIKTRLETLILDENHFRTKSWARMATLIAMSKNLRHLSLRQCTIEDEAFQGITDVLLLTRHLRRLDVTSNMITDVSILEYGLVSLLTHSICPPITDLLLESNMISSVGAEMIFKALANSGTIERVSLADNRITDEFVVWLYRHLKSQRLEKMRVSLTQVDLHDNGLTSDLNRVKD